MPRETSSESTGTAMPDISMEQVLERFKLNEKEYGKLPLMCQTALKEAISMVSVGTGLSNLFMVYAQNYDGENLECLICSRDGHDAIERFIREFGYDADHEWESVPTAHQLPMVHRMGVVNWGSCPQTRYSQI